MVNIETVADLVQIINIHPEWRRELKKALFPDVDLEKALQRLSETEERILAKQDRLETGQQEIKTDVSVLKTDVSVLKTDVSVLKTDVSVLKTDVSVLKTDVSVLKTDVSVLKTDVAVLKTDVSVLKTDVAVLKKDMTVVKTDVGTLKGKMHKVSYRLKAAAIFGRFLKRGRDVTHEIADRLQEAETAGQISSDEYIQVLAADLLWGGKTRQGDQEIVLVVEASWLAEEADVIRAATRAAILRRLGVVALPVVTGEEWKTTAKELAAQEGVVVALDGIVDNDSWHNIFR